MRRNDGLIAALELLVQSRDYAWDAGCDIWDFAVEFRFLRRAGLTISDVRWLVCKGFVEHRPEVSEDNDLRRSFRSGGGLKFCRGSCFVISPSGIEFASAFHEVTHRSPTPVEVAPAEVRLSPSTSHRIVPVADVPTNHVPTNHAPTNHAPTNHAPTNHIANDVAKGVAGSTATGSDATVQHGAAEYSPPVSSNGHGKNKPVVPPLTPRWDGDFREVRYDNHVVKQFKLPSPNQEAILVAFEEEGWPPRIDDPLSPHPNCDPKQRLHDTIRSLNRNQKHRLLRFKGDGTGQGVLWEPRPDVEDEESA